MGSPTPSKWPVSLFQPEPEPQRERSSSVGQKSAEIPLRREELIHPVTSRS